MRQNGTLELMIAAPVPLLSIIAPVMLTSAARGCSCRCWSIADESARALPRPIGADSRNGFAVATISFGLGAWILEVHVRSSELAGLALALLVSCSACTSLGLCIGALGLRGRNVSVFADSIGAVMLVMSGANVPFDRLPHIVRTIASGMPLTHAVDAARQLANGATIVHVANLLGAEVAIAVAYFAASVFLLRLFEQQARASGSFDRF